MDNTKEYYRRYFEIEAEEMETGMVSLKNMITGEQNKINANEIVNQF